MPSISKLLSEAVAHLRAGDSPRLDAELLLCHLLKKPRSYLFAWPEREVDADTCAAYRQLIASRVAGIPVAHLTGEREFWSLSFKITADTLVPRPETELLVELALAAVDRQQLHSALDLGTGSGAIALSLAYERTQLAVTAVDASHAALAVARENVRRHQLQRVRLQHSDWYSALAGQRFELIVSNPPYIAEGDPDLDADALNHEPQRALLAADNGLADIRQIANGALAHLQPGGLLLVEHGWKQGAAVRQLFEAAGLLEVRTNADLAGRERVTQGRAAR